jgi:hypothetical protein
MFETNVRLVGVGWAMTMATAIAGSASVTVKTNRSRGDLGVLVTMTSAAGLLFRP